MSCVRRRGARLAGALSLIALLLVPAALATHVHADPLAARSCAVCVAAHHSPAVTSPGPAVARGLFLAPAPGAPRRSPRGDRARGPRPAAPGARRRLRRRRIRLPAPAAVSVEDPERRIRWGTRRDQGCSWPPPSWRR